MIKMWPSDYGMMAIPEGMELDAQALNELAERRYLNGEDLSALSPRRLPAKKRLGDTDG